MKKNTMMRVASVLLVAVLLSTSVISGTFAKYTTQDGASDVARVAKWGVTAVVSGDLFGADYVAGSGSATEGIISASYTGSADSANPAGPEKIVAPGTNSDKGVTITINGTPEVSNTVTFASTADNNKDIYLKAGNYGTMVKVAGITADNFAAGTYYTKNEGTYTKAASFDADVTEYFEVHDIAEVGADYYPIVWTVTGTGAGTYTKVSDMVTALGAFNGTNNSLVAIDKTCNISWAWAFTGDGRDGADTILGNIIAADGDAVPVKTTNSGDTYTTLATTDYSTTVAFNYSITVTQVD